MQCAWICLELCGYGAVTFLGHRVPSFPSQEMHLPKFNYVYIITWQVSSNIAQNLKCTSWGSSCTSWCRSSICSGRNRQGSTSVTSCECRNNPYSACDAISTTYMAVLPPVLNIIPVSWTLEVCSRWDLEWFSDSLDIGHDKCLCNVHGTGHNEVTSSNCQVKLSWLPHWKTFAMETKESTESKAFYCQYYFQQGLAVLQT